jgi:hypothetical protein
MNVMEDARKRVKSKATGIGESSLKGMSKHVQASRSGSSSGNRPRRAKSYHLSDNIFDGIVVRTKYLIFLILPVESDPLCSVNGIIYGSMKQDEPALWIVGGYCMQREVYTPPEVTKGSSVTENRL